MKEAGGAPAEVGFTPNRHITLSKSAVAGLDGVLANARNLMGFLDAFKAVFEAGLAF
jgi:hypothetical protein